MDGKKLITIYKFGGEFETDEDGTLSYNGGEAHAIDIDHETPFEEFKSEIAEILNCSSEFVLIKYFLPGNRKTPITISNDRDFKRMISFNEDSVMVDVYVTAEESDARCLSNMPGSRSSGTALSEAPPILSIDPSDVKHLTVPISWKNAIIGVRQRFRGVHEFREALRKYSIAHAFAYKFEKNHIHRVTAKCKSESCTWRVHAARLLTTQLFCIKTMNPIHTCERGALTSGSHATTNLVASIVKEKLRDSPNYKPKDIVDDIKREYGVNLHYWQAWRVKDIAREQLMGSYKESYSQLPFLCEEIKETNPGSFATFTTKDDSSFHRLFISFHASLYGFQQGCRPLLFLDSFHLKSKYRETLLVAKAVDGDDGVFPVAFAVVDDETVDNWHWFLLELKSAVSTSRSITFVADMEKGLRESIAEVFENGYHGYCLRYLSEKFRKELPTQFSHEVKRMLVADFYAAAYAPKLKEFQRSGEAIKAISPEAFSWIGQSKPEHWANVYFGGARYNHMTSNFGEMFCIWVSEAYDLPITQMVHMIRGKMMELINSRSVDSREWLTHLTPSMEEKLQKEILKAGSLELEVLLSPGTDGLYDVCGDSIEKVDIDQWNCSCKGWQITGLPCFHAVAVFNYIGRSPYDYCSRYFTTDRYRLTYSKSINPVSNNEDKPMQKESCQATVVVAPPPIRRPLVRSKIKRNVSQELDTRKRRRSKCKGVGHTIS